MIVMCDIMWFALTCGPGKRFRMQMLMIALYNQKMK